VWARLRIPRKEIKRRMKLAARIRPRRQLSGPPLPPELAVVADAVQSGAIGEDHLRTICRAIDVLPSCVSAVDRGDVEASLVREAGKHDADFVKVIGRRIDEIFNPDGHLDGFNGDCAGCVLARWPMRSQLLKHPLGDMSG
jgi:hypothetical protein